MITKMSFAYFYNQNFVKSKRFEKESKSKSIIIFTAFNFFKI